MTNHDTERRRQAEFARQATGSGAPPKPSGGRSKRKRTFTATFDGRRHRKAIDRIEAAIEASGLGPDAWIARALDRMSSAELNKARQRRRGQY